MQIHYCAFCDFQVDRPRGTYYIDVQCPDGHGPMSTDEPGWCDCGRAPATIPYSTCRRCCDACFGQWIDAGYLYPEAL